MPRYAPLWLRMSTCDHADAKCALRSFVHDSQVQNKGAVLNLGRTKSWKEIERSLGCALLLVRATSAACAAFDALLTHDGLATAHPPVLSFVLTFTRSVQILNPVSLATHSLCPTAPVDALLLPTQPHLEATPRYLRSRRKLSRAAREPKSSGDLRAHARSRETSGTRTLPGRLTTTSALRSSWNCRLGDASGEPRPPYPLQQHSDPEASGAVRGVTRGPRHHRRAYSVLAQRNWA